MGVDCIGVVEQTVIHFGLCPDYVPVRGYARDPSGGQMRTLLEQHLERIPKEVRYQGDVLHFAWGEEPQHLGILTGRGTVINAYASAGRCVEQTLEGALLRRVRAVYRIPGVVMG